MPSKKQEEKRREKRKRGKPPEEDSLRASATLQSLRLPNQSFILTRTLSPRGKSSDQVLGDASLWKVESTSRDEADRKKEERLRTARASALR